MISLGINELLTVGKSAARYLQKKYERDQMNPKYLQQTFFLDFGEPSVQEYAVRHTRGLSTNKEKAAKLFQVVRDGFIYNPYYLTLKKQNMRASAILKRKSAYCNEKALVLTACLRYLGIPARLYFGNVKNHIGTKKLEKLLQTDVLAFHGCVEVFLNEKWVKATPAFNSELCQKLGVEPLKFNGEEDAIFQEFGKNGQRFMEYIEVHGSFDDLPYDLFVAELRKHYGHLEFQDELEYRLF